MWFFRKKKVEKEEKLTELSPLALIKLGAMAQLQLNMDKDYRTQQIYPFDDHPRYIVSIPGIL